MFLSIFIIIPFLSMDSVSRDTGFVVTLVLVVIIGVSEGILQGSLYGFIATFPPQYTHALQTGYYTIYCINSLELDFLHLLFRSAGF